MNATPDPQETATPSLTPPAESPHLPLTPEPPRHLMTVPGSAGHGPARARALLTLAASLGASASLISGGTRTRTLTVAVDSPPPVFDRISSLWEQLLTAAESFAAQKRAEARSSASPPASYQVAVLTRSAIEGFGEGAASVLRPASLHRPPSPPTRARLSDDSVHRSGVAAGRAWASRLQRESASH